MADLERGQLIVTGALVIAATLVTIGLILNFVIYTENLATRDTNQEARNANELRVDAVEDVGRAIRYVNLNERSSQTELENGIQDELEVMREHYGRYGVLGGRTTNFVKVDHTFGTRVAQTDETRSLTDKDGDGDWMVLQGIDPKTTTASGAPVDNPHYFTMTLDRASLFEADPTDTKDIIASQAFRIQIEERNDPTDTLDRVWQLYFFRDQVGNVHLLVNDEPTFDNPGETLDQFLDQTCKATSSQEPILELTEAKFGTSSCPALEGPGSMHDSFFPYTLDPNKVFRVGYVNAEVSGIVRAAGTFEILIEEDSPDPNGVSPDVTANYNSVGSGQPFQAPALFSVTISITSITDETDYKADQLAVPVVSARTDRAGFAPQIVSCTMTDTGSGSSPQYEVDWTVEDIDSNLKEVNLILADGNGERVDTISHTSVSGSSASSTDTLSDSSPDLLGDTYTVRISVQDERGNVRASSWTDTADGLGSTSSCTT